MGNTAVIYNPQKVDKSRLQTAVDTALARAGMRKAHYFPTTENDHGGPQAKQALADKAAALAAGDWTAYGKADAKLKAAIDALLGLVK